MNEQTNEQRYKRIFINFMSFTHGTEYSFDHVFDEGVLGQIVPNDVYRWMCLKVFGTPDPLPGDNPTSGQASSLEYYKKAISCYMPNKLQPWNALASTGNPTRSILVNQLIKLVRKKQVRKQGKESAVRRPLQPEEFEQTIAILQQYPDVIHRYQMPSFCKFQFHMIGRVDDVARVKKDIFEGKSAISIYFAMSNVLVKKCK